MILQVLEKYVTLGDDGSSVTSEELPSLKKVYFVRRQPAASGQDFLTNLEASSDWFVADDVSPDDVCSVFTTSGSSGFSKLVVHTHKGYHFLHCNDNA